MNTKIILGIIVVIIIAVFITMSFNNNTNEAAQQYTGDAITYQAEPNDNTLVARFSETGEAVQVAYNNETYELESAVSASGARYTNTDESVVFWTHQGEGTLEIADEIVFSAAEAGEMIDTTQPGDSNANHDDFVGMTETEAETKAEEDGVPFRVVERDGEMLPTTRDYRIGRINAVVEAGVVTAYTIEGSEETTETNSNDEIIGMTEAEAQAYAETNDVDFRVGMRDGEALPVTLDFRPGRITAKVENGVVTEYTTE